MPSYYNYSFCYVVRVAISIKASSLCEDRLGIMTSFILHHILLTVLIMSKFSRKRYNSIAFVFKLRVSDWNRFKINISSSSTNHETFSIWVVMVMFIWCILINILKSLFEFCNVRPNNRSPSQSLLFCLLRLICIFATNSTSFCYSVTVRQKFHKSVNYMFKN